MLRSTILLALLLTSSGLVQKPSYTPDAKLKYPADYRQWIFLSSGLDMAYNRGQPIAAHSAFDNVFVNPAAWHAFQQTGTWPDGTSFVLEIRGAAADASINKQGRTQSGDATAVEVHLKDASHGGWSFYAFDGTTQPAARLAQTEACYTCHQQHAAVDTTFVQFYPTLLPIAKNKQTLSKEYLHDVATTNR